MLQNFFKLDAPFESFDEKALLAALKTSRHICNILYSPDRLEDKRISGVTFENVSFSKTEIERVTFTNCKFQDCLFIGTSFNSVEFHGCTFIECNFYKSVFKSVYGRPGQFLGAITRDEFSNIAVGLYHQLRENYYQESQREYKNEAEYQFLHWHRKNEYLQAKRASRPWYTYQFQHAFSYLYGHLFGYGYRVRNLAITTTLMLLAIMWANYAFAQCLFKEPVEPSVATTIYFTLTTMTTLGASGYSPNTEIGYFFVLLNVFFGISVFSATITAVLKKVIR